ncbi:MAG: YciI family protein [Burkholderiales bacterium]|nr:YciI family protein [Burkholderiales bacterium]
MEFVLTFNQPAAEIERYADPVAGPIALAPWMAYMDDLAAAGVMRGGARLSPPWTATTVRVQDGVRHVQDGPFADTKELVGGFIIIDVPSLDEALAWAARSPSSSAGSTEVRPVMPAPQ